MKPKLLIGSANKDKVEELARLLDSLHWELLSLADVPPVEAPEETGSTFEENALLKAAFYSKQYDLPCVADDSGLEVDALDGAPGVYSARYAGPGCSYTDNNDKLLEAMENCLWYERTARFVCCAAFVTPEDLPQQTTGHTVEGVVEGHIAVEPLGDNGFGYDPLFVPYGHEKTFAQMPETLKHQLSHRGHAFKKMSQYLIETYK